eukprot:6552941-Lingulodinium_polyedra.AAC.1
MQCKSGEHEFNARVHDCSSDLSLFLLLFPGNGQPQHRVMNMSSMQDVWCPQFAKRTIAHFDGIHWHVQ